MLFKINFATEVGRIKNTKFTMKNKIVINQRDVIGVNYFLNYKISSKQQITCIYTKLKNAFLRDATPFPSVYIYIPNSRHNIERFLVAVFKIHRKCLYTQLRYVCLHECDSIKVIGKSRIVQSKGILGSDKSQSKTIRKQLADSYENTGKT